MRFSILLLALVSFFSGSAWARVEIRDQGNERVYTISLEDPKFSGLQLANRAFSKMELIGADGYTGILAQEGNPELPVIRLLLPAEKARVTATGAQVLRLPNRDAPIRPFLPSAVKIRGSEQRFVMNQKTYRSASPFPNRNYMIAPAGSIRGQKQILVTLFPANYRPGTGSIDFRRSFEVRIPRDNGKSTEASLNNGQSTIAFVVGQKFAQSPSLKRYVEFKEGQGFKVEQIVRTQETPQEIRAGLRRLYAQNPQALRFAILVGDAEDVPGYESTHISGITDHYYSSLDTDNYDQDIFTPDIAVGRFSATNESELEAMVEKYIAYQRGIFANERWLNSAAFLATDDRYQVAEASHNYVIDTYTKALGYQGIFPTSNNPGGDQLYAITHHAPASTVQEALRAGRTIVDYSGHGAETFWDAPRVTQDDVRALRDDSALPFVISNACITANFRVEESFAETWQRHRYGAVAFWGSMDSTYWDEDDILERRMFDGIYTLNKNNFGEITQYGLSELAKHYGNGGRSDYYWETYHLFGDPSALLRTSYTRTVTFQGPTEVPIGMGSVELRVADEQGRPWAEQNVALFDGGGRVVASSRTNGQGLVQLALPEGLTPGTQIRAVAQGVNLRESSQTLTMISPNTPYLSLRNARVNGRSDLTASPGEDLEMSFDLINVGQKPASGARIEIDSVQGPAAVIQAGAGIGPLQPSGSTSVEGGLFRLRISPTAKMDDRVQVQVTWTTVEGSAGKITIQLRVVAGRVEVQQTNFAGSSVANSGLRSGETGQAFVTVKNTGTEEIVNAILEATPRACVLEAKGQLQIDRLAVGESRRIEMPITLTTDPNCVSGTSGAFLLAGYYVGRGGMTGLEAQANFTIGVMNFVEAAQSAIGLAIKDNTTVTQEIAVAGKGIVTNIGIHVMMTHSYFGDISIDLVHPDGTSVRLYDHDGGSGSSLDLNLGLGGNQTKPELAAFNGKPMGGTWKLVIEDNAGGDEGTLDQYKLTLQGFVE